MQEKSVILERSSKKSGLVKVTKKTSLKHDMVSIYLYPKIGYELM